MANVKITDLPADGAPVDGSAIEVASLSGSTFTSKRMLLSTLASYVVGKFNALLDAAPLTIARGGTGAATAPAAARALGVPWTVAASGAPVSITGTTTETALATITIPAGAIGPNGCVEIIALCSFTASTNARVIRARLSGSEIWSASITTAVSSNRVITGFQNTGSQSTQVSHTGTVTGVGSSAASLFRTSINTAAATTLTITGTLATSSETITLESYLVRINYGA